MEQKLKGYSWDMDGYMTHISSIKPKAEFSGMKPKTEFVELTMHDAQNAFKLYPPLPKRAPDSDPNDYIVKAQETREIKYVFFYLDEKEDYFNRRIISFLLNGRGEITPIRFMDLKLDCKAEVLIRFPDYDPSAGASFITFIHRSITDVMLRYAKSEESYSFESLSEYKAARRIMQIYTDCHGSSEETIRIFSQEYNCSEKTAAGRLKAARQQRNRLIYDVEATEADQDWETEEDQIPDYWDYESILWLGMLAEKMDQAFKKLSFRDKALLEGRNAICLKCGRVSSLAKRKSFEELAELFEGSSVTGAEQAYKRALEKLIIELVKLDQLHYVRIRQESVQRESKKITAAVYAYQVDNDGEWGEIRFDLSEKTAWVETFAEKDPCNTWAVTDAAIQAVLECEEEKLPKKTLIPVALESYPD